jgi:hypothetical protein
MSIYYRADKRTFDIGQTIRTAGHFTLKNPTQEETLGEAVESIFERLRPESAPPRATSLFLFNDLLAAQWHWSKMTGGILYEAFVRSDVAFVGDMKLVNQAGNCSSVIEVETLAKQYWSQEHTSDPVFELLVPEAIISTIVCDNQQERQAILMKFARGELPIP